MRERSVDGESDPSGGQAGGTIPLAVDLSQSQKPRARDDVDLRKSIRGWFSVATGNLERRNGNDYPIPR